MPSRLCTAMGLHAHFKTLRVRFCHPPSPLLQEEGHEEACSVHYPNFLFSGLDEYANTDGDSAEVTVITGRRPSLHRTRRPSSGILKVRRSKYEPEQVDYLHPQSDLEFNTHVHPNGSDNSYACGYSISVKRYRTSCCAALVCLELIADWIDSPSSSDIQNCPSCGQTCTLNLELNHEQEQHPLTALSKSISPGKSDLISNSDSRALLAMMLVLQFLQYYLPIAASKAGLKLDMHQQFSAHGRPVHSGHGARITDARWRLEAEMESDLSAGLNLREGFIRLTSIGGLTLVLFTLLS